MPRPGPAERTPLVSALPEAPVLHDNNLIHWNEATIGEAVSCLGQRHESTPIEGNAVPVIPLHARIAGAGAKQ